MNKPIFFPLTPRGAPRQTRADAWKGRDCVIQYRADKDLLSLIASSFDFELGDSFVMHAYFLYPKSYSKKKILGLEETGGWHKVKPDFDNVAKGLCDALAKNDSYICNVTVRKLWVTDSERVGILIVPVPKKTRIEHEADLGITDFSTIDGFECAGQQRKG